MTSYQKETHRSISQDRSPSQTNSSKPVRQFSNTPPLLQTPPSLTSLRYRRTSHTSSIWYTRLRRTTLTIQRDAPSPLVMKSTKMRSIWCTISELLLLPPQYHDYFRGIEVDSKDIDFWLFIHSSSASSHSFSFPFVFADSVTVIFCFYLLYSFCTTTNDLFRSKRNAEEWIF